MASNGYHQQYPARGPAPQQRHYQGQYPQAAHPPPSQHNGYPRGQLQIQNTEPNPYDRIAQSEQYDGRRDKEIYDQNGYSQRYMQDTQWDNGYVEDPQQYQQQHMQRDQGHRQERNYQYDQRYRTNGVQRPALQQAQTYGGQSTYTANQAERQRPPAVKTKSTERQRILKDEGSPTSIPWDNPFGAFPTKKRAGDMKPPGSSDGTSLQSPEVSANSDRPSTSHSNRKRVEQPRPHTSHDQRPGLQDNNFEQRQGMLPPDGPSQPLRTDAFNPPPRDQLPRRPPPQRAMTGPPREPIYDNPPMPPDHNFPPHQQQLPRQQSHGEQPFQRPEQPGRTDSYRQMQPVNTSIAPVRPEYRTQTTSPYERQQFAEQQRQPLHYHSQDNVDDSSYRGIPLTKKISPEPSNLDVMTYDYNERVGDQSSMASQSNNGPTYRKPVYGAAPVSVPDNNTRSYERSEVEQLRSPLAQFSFGVNGGRAAASESHSLPQSPIRQDFDQSQFRRYPPVRQPTQDLSNSDHAVPGNQFPPRSVSRTATGRPLPSGGGYGLPPAVPSANIQRRPTDERGTTQNYSTAYPNSSDNNHESYQNGRTQAMQSPVQHRPSNSFERDRSGYDPRLAPHVDSMPSQQYQQGPAQPPQGSYNNYPPSTNGQTRKASGETFRSNMTAGSNPDSLPSHPVPFRPGLTQPNPQRPPPMPTPAQSAPPPQQRQPTLPVAAESKATIVTVQELNNLRESFKAKPNDHALGLRFAKRLVEAAVVLSNENGKADAKQTAKNRERYILDAHKLVKRLISAGYPEAMFYMADCYGQGLLGLQPDPKEAFSLYQSAAKLGHAQGAYRVAVCCELGPDEGGGTRRDPLKSVQWYKRAASLGDTPAMYKMGMIQLKGLLGQPRNPREAITWLKRAGERADSENPHALHELALLYENAQSSDIVVRDEKYALQLFTQAAELGYKYSQFRLGSTYEYGLLGCPIDPRLSIAWYSRAAAQGEHQSEFALSGWYLTGSGTPPPGEQPLLQQSDTEAYLWARKAATSGLTKAEYAMGYYTEVGIGVAANVEEAKKWYFRAAAQNHPKARERLEDLKKGGARMQKTRVSRSNVGKHNEGECTVM